MVLTSVEAHSRSLHHVPQCTQFYIPAIFNPWLAMENSLQWTQPSRLVFPIIIIDCFSASCFSCRIA